MLLAELTITGHPAVLKNSKNVVPIPAKGSKKCRLCGLQKTRNIPITNKKAKQAQIDAECQMRRQWMGARTIDVFVRAEFTFFGAWKRDNNNYPDTSNLYELPQDAMQSAEIITDDRLIDNHDGSRRIFLCDLPCPRREVLKSGPRKGELKDNCGQVKKCPFEKTIIRLYSINDDVETANFEDDF
jgi:Holliday junction resolvase RusA-like endonuclease